MSNRPQRRSRKRDEPPGNDWLVTFSDCMTLLLTFFVMLLSFSSFDPKDLTRVFMAFKAPSMPSVFRGQRLPQDSPLPDDAEVDWTEDGSEKPNDDRLEPTHPPRKPLDPLGDDAYRDRRVLTIPSELLFWGRGDRLKPVARDLLGHVANYLRLVPCRVVISETSPTAAARPGALSRAWAVMNHFTDAENLKPDRFAISGSPGAAKSGAGFEPVVRIAMLNQKVYP